MECGVTQVVTKSNIRIICHQKPESLLGTGPDDMEERRFPRGIDMIHRNTGLYAIAQFFQVTKPGRLNNIIRVLAGWKECNPRQAKSKGR